MSSTLINSAGRRSLSATGQRIRGGAGTPCCCWRCMPSNPPLDLGGGEMILGATLVDGATSTSFTGRYNTDLEPQVPFFFRPPDWTDRLPVYRVLTAAGYVVWHLFASGGSGSDRMLLTDVDGAPYGSPVNNVFGLESAISGMVPLSGNRVVALSQRAGSGSSSPAVLDIYDLGPGGGVVSSGNAWLDPFEIGGAARYTSLVRDGDLFYATATRGTGGTGLQYIYSLKMTGESSIDFDDRWDGEHVQPLPYPGAMGHANRLLSLGDHLYLFHAGGLFEDGPRPHVLKISKTTGNVVDQSADTRLNCLIFARDSSRIYFVESDEVYASPNIETLVCMDGNLNIIWRVATDELLGIDHDVNMISGLSVVGSYLFLITHCGSTSSAVVRIDKADAGNLVKFPPYPFPQV